MLGLQLSTTNLQLQFHETHQLPDGSVPFPAQIAFPTPHPQSAFQPLFHQGTICGLAPQLIRAEYNGFQEWVGTCGRLCPGIPGPCSLPPEETVSINGVPFGRNRFGFCLFVFFCFVFYKCQALKSSTGQALLYLSCIKHSSLH